MDTDALLTTQERIDLINQLTPERLKEFCLLLAMLENFPLEERIEQPLALLWQLGDTQRPQYGVGIPAA